MTKLFNEVTSNTLENFSSLGEGNIVFSSNENQYMLSTFKQALLKFKNQESFSIREEWFSDVELLTEDQFNIILQKLTS